MNTAPGELVDLAGMASSVSAASATPALWNVRIVDAGASFILHGQCRASGLQHSRSPLKVLHTEAGKGQEVRKVKTSFWRKLSF
jgi:hypothetical protein